MSMMLEAKSRRLQAKGWKIGSAREFLGMTDQEEEYVELRLKLADALKRQRIRRQSDASGFGKDDEIEPITGCKDGSR